VAAMSLRAGLCPSRGSPSPRNPEAPRQAGVRSVAGNRSNSRHRTSECGHYPDLQGLAVNKEPRWQGRGEQ